VSYEHIRFEPDEGMATITISRPDPDPGRFGR
jgi:hypothetical protein